MRNSTKKALSIIISIIMIALITLYLYKNPQIFNEIKKLETIYIIPLIILTLISLYINGLFFKIVSKPFKIELKEHFAISLATSFFNLITPFKGGAGIRAVYMKKKHKLNYSDFIASLFGTYIIIFLSSSLSALIIFLIIYLQYGIFNIPSFLIFCVIFFGTLFITKTKFQFKKENFISSNINKVLKGWKIINKDKKIIVKLVVLNITNIIIQTLIIKTAFQSIGVEIDLIKSLFLSVMGTLAIFISITPGSLGITESIYFISATILGISPGLSLIVALIIRAISTITLLITGPIANIYLLKSTSSSIQKKEIRKTHLKERLNYDNKKLQDFSDEILKKLEALEVFQKAKNIMFYIPIKNEVNTIPIIKKYIRKKQIALPKIQSDKKIHAHLLESFENLKTGKYKIEEPNDETPEIDPQKLDIIIIPGISFDKQGLRIGYGKGYYDEFLKTTKAKKIALAYDFQIHKNIKGEIHDEKVDLIITEKSIIKINLSITL